MKDKTRDKIVRDGDPSQEGMLKRKVCKKLPHTDLGAM